MLFRKDNQWFLKNLSRTGEGRDFKELEPLMKSSMEFLIPKILQEEGTSRDPKKSFNMKKGDSVDIEGTSFTLGLGWDVSSSGIDLDSSCVLLSKGIVQEKIYFGNRVCSISSKCLMRFRIRKGKQ